MTCNRKILEILFEKQKRNSNIIRNLKLFQISVNPTEFNKALTNTGIIDSLTSDEGLNFGTNVIDIDLPDFPEELIPYTKVVLKGSIEEGFDLTKDISSLSDEFANGTLENGDIQLSVEFSYLWTQIEKNHHTLKINFRSRAVQATVTQFGFFGTDIPVLIKCDLSIINERLNYELQSNKK